MKCPHCKKVFVKCDRVVHMHPAGYRISQWRQDRTGACGIATTPEFITTDPAKVDCGACKRRMPK